MGVTPIDGDTIVEPPDDRHTLPTTPSALIENGLPAAQLVARGAPPLNRATMAERLPERPHRVAAGDWQMLAAAYRPVIAFAAVLITARISGTRRHRLQAAFR